MSTSGNPAVPFPAKPEAMKSTYDSLYGKALPSMIYTAEDDHVRYSLTVVDLAGMPDDGALRDELQRIWGEAVFDGFLLDEARNATHASMARGGPTGCSAPPRATTRRAKRGTIRSMPAWQV
jgi:hypothetical protein